MHQFREKRTSSELPVDFSSVWEGREGERGMLCVLCSPSGRVWLSSKGLMVSLGSGGSHCGSELSEVWG